MIQMGWETFRVFYASLLMLRREMDCELLSGVETIQGQSCIVAVAQLGEEL